MQVGSHCHFFEVNRCVSLARPAAYGMRRNIAAGTAVRFEPGDRREVELVDIGGPREVYSLNGLVNGALDDEEVRKRALDAVKMFSDQWRGRQFAAARAVLRGVFDRPVCRS